MDLRFIFTVQGFLVYIYSAVDLMNILRVLELYGTCLQCKGFIVYIYSAGDLRFIFTVQEIHGLYSQCRRFSFYICSAVDKMVHIYSAGSLWFIFTVQGHCGSYLQCRGFTVHIYSTRGLRFIFTVQGLYGSYLLCTIFAVHNNNAFDLLFIFTMQEIMIYVYSGRNLLIRFRARDIFTGHITVLITCILCQSHLWFIFIVRIFAAHICSAKDLWLHICSAGYLCFIFTAQGIYSLYLQCRRITAHIYSAYELYGSYLQCMDFTSHIYNARYIILWFMFTIQGLNSSYIPCRGFTVPWSYGSYLLCR